MRKRLLGKFIKMKTEVTSKVHKLVSDENGSELLEKVGGIIIVVVVIGLVVAAVVAFFPDLWSAIKTKIMSIFN